MSNQFSRKKINFHDRVLPEEGILIGYGWLLQIIEDTRNRRLPLPERLAIITEKQQRYNTPQWQVFAKRYMPEDSAIGHLTFALKYEGLDLLILKEFFLAVGDTPVMSMMQNEPTGQYSRRIWFLYEWLFDKTLDIPDLKTGNYVEVVNPKHQYVGPVENSTRHRVKNNLPGTREFCPMIRKTKKLEAFTLTKFPEIMEKGLKGRNKDLIRRTAAFLLLKDSKASFAIEGEYPPNMRARNWGKAIGQAGKKPLTIEEIERLQDIVIGTKKLKHMGIRKGEGFIGEHDRESLLPMPDHISAQAKDLQSLLGGLIETNNLLQGSGYDPVLAAASIAFGFVFIHPLSDGNGRIHRYIIHHILVRMGYTQRDMIFPISAAILNRIGAYQDILEHFSSPRLDLIEWKPTPDHNVEILNDTIDLYRYFDATLQTEFLYECVEETIEKIIPEELDFLEKYDQMTHQINALVNLPDNKVDLLIKLFDQNSGKLSKNKWTKEFDQLSQEEIESIEKIYASIF
ncbi:Fic family protein [Flagellimonas meridianipacifica]|uniref:Fic/DOC family protein n=1 Tax=Flagellimonas meridianipacifica TaxID=1080225 RepID=A0A2T0MEX1_9FLAO|nr:Fic family protein [Allomuricauda pacifica]PRX56086.1 Fic/DOC family protein [Allomuricauda pacifica]